MRRRASEGECGLLARLSGIPAGLGRGSRDSICGAQRAKLDQRVTLPQCGSWTTLAVAYMCAHTETVVVT